MFLVKTCRGHRKWNPGMSTATTKAVSKGLCKKTQISTFLQSFSHMLLLNSGVISRNSGVISRNSGVISRNSGVIYPNSGIISRFKVKAKLCAVENRNKGGFCKIPLMFIDIVNVPQSLGTLSHLTWRRRRAILIFFLQFSPPAIFNTLRRF